MYVVCVHMFILGFCSWSMMKDPKACFSKHSQWPPKSFRLRQA
ncbi:hypothetical protein I3760_03G125200 [Carya illinoinensis]|nr:hypothetical protein I3760_03G125200 [Carya illinoinensis]